MRVALYTRVSTEEQSEGDSIDNQDTRLKAYAESRAWGVHKVYVDPGHTGRDTKRPGYQELIKEIDDWDGLLVLKMDRAHRNTKNFLGMMELLHKKDKCFISVEDPIDSSTAMGRALMTIISSMAQLESEQIGERVISVMEHKAKDEDTNLKALGGRRPYGYDWNKGPDDKVIPEDPLRINPQESQVILRIFECFDNQEKVKERVSKKFKGYRGGIYSLIANTLNHKKIPSPRGAQWSAQGVKNIIGRRAFYEGREVSWRGHKRDATHEPILGGAQARIERFKENP